MQAASSALRLRGFHPLWRSFPEPSTPASPAKPCGLLRFRSPLLAEYFLFLRVLRCFSSPGALYPTYVFSREYVGMPPRGFPHSDISGSPAAHAYPELFVVYHVLHRRLTPRHPPCALVAFDCLLRRRCVSRVSLLSSCLLFAYELVKVLASPLAGADTWSCPPGRREEEALGCPTRPLSLLENSLLALLRCVNS
jgi:hypothetical protein